MADEKLTAAKRFRRWLLHTPILYFVVAFWVYLFDALPLPLARFFGRCGGGLAFHLDRAHRRGSLDNLAIAFPEKNAHERRAILKASYKHLGMVIVEFCHLKSIRPEDLRAHWIVPEDDADGRIRAALAQGKGMIAVGTHIGSWELAGFAFPTLGYPLVSISRRIPSPRVEELVLKIRSRLGNEVVHKEGALRHMLRALKDNKCLGIIMDQYAGRESPWVPFFGREASTIDSVARLHLRTGCPVMFNIMTRRPDGKFRWRCIPIQPPPPVEGESDDARVRGILMACHKEFEAAIRETPEQWLWMHKRWKPRPADLPVVKVEDNTVVTSP